MFFSFKNTSLFNLSLSTRKDREEQEQDTCYSGYKMLKNSTFSFRMLTSKSRMLVDGEIRCSLSSSGSTLPNQEVTSARSELSLCHCSRSCLMSLSSLLNLGALSSSHRWITPAHRQRSAYRSIYRGAAKTTLFHFYFHVDPLEMLHTGSLNKQ